MLAGLTLGLLAAALTPDTWSGLVVPVVGLLAVVVAWLWGRA